MREMAKPRVRYQSRHNRTKMMDQSMTIERNNWTQGVTEEIWSTLLAPIGIRREHLIRC